MVEKQHDRPKSGRTGSVQGFTAEHGGSGFDRRDLRNLQHALMMTNSAWTRIVASEVVNATRNDVATGLAYLRAPIRTGAIPSILLVLIEACREHIPRMCVTCSRRGSAEWLPFVDPNNRGVRPRAVLFECESNGRQQPGIPTAIWRCCGDWEA